MSYFPFVVSALVTLSLIAVFLSGRLGKKFQDIPNERSLHSVPVPRVGGVGLIAGVLSGWALMIGSLAWWLVLPLIGLCVISLLDDMHSLPVRQRLSVQIVAAAILVVGSGLHAQQGSAVALIVLLLTVWMTNLYNFMDGSDGLAGGMAMFGFAFYGIAALMAHDDALATLNFVISASALAFLLFNFPPAKVFMGDAGSIPLGFLAAAIGLLGWQKGYWPVWFPLLVFSPFIADASVTLVKRTLRGVKITEAHREHYYQRAIQLGQSHRNVAWVEYALMLASGISALWCLQRSQSWPLLLAWIGIYATLMFLVDLRWNKKAH
jgi:UDP-N-acetylmuramyl pentapeptide phosphotransferase/UDP-N-acetylglucosamine-1-phosphate transferase